MKKRKIYFKSLLAILNKKAYFLFFKHKLKFCGCGTKILAETPLPLSHCDKIWANVILHTSLNFEPHFAIIGVPISKKKCSVLEDYFWTTWVRPSSFWYNFSENWPPYNGIFDKYFAKIGLPTIVFLIIFLLKLASLILYFLIGRCVGGGVSIAGGGARK